jgi:hypothetical protein
MSPLQFRSGPRSIAEIRSSCAPDVKFLDSPKKGMGHHIIVSQDHTRFRTVMWGSLVMTKSVLLPNCICFNGIHVTSPEKAQISHGVHEVLSLGLGEGAQGIDGHTTLRILSDQCFFGTRGPMRETRRINSAGSQIQDPKEEMALKFTVHNHSEWIFTIPSFPTSQLPTILFLPTSTARSKAWTMGVLPSCWTNVASPSREVLAQDRDGVWAKGWSNN